jgi:uncharacterized protein (TIGR02466 family)
MIGSILCISLLSQLEPKQKSCSSSLCLEEQLLWPTRFSKANLLNQQSEEFNLSLNSAAEKHFDAFMSDVLAHRALSDTILSDLNNGFYQHQRIHPKLFSGMPEVDQLKTWAKEACKGHLSSEGNWLAGEDDFDDLVSIQIWASVFIKGSSHPEHFHSGALCSGVYYSASPAESAPLVLHDPRVAVVGSHSTRPDAQFNCRPQAGDLVVFPPWATHHVGVHNSAARRVAWSFNLFIPGF